MGLALLPPVFLLALFVGVPMSCCSEQSNLMPGRRGPLWKSAQRSACVGLLAVHVLQ